MKKGISILLCFISAITYSQSQFYEKGQIIDSISVGKMTNESFALYLPNTYNKEESSAIIFIFDPLARGKKGIEVFKEAANTYNYMLVCSNNSQNGPYALNFEIANRLFSYVFSEFKIDAKQIYTAGFSGGSRFASSIAVLSNSIQGVIACGAGFSPMGNQRPNFGNNFSYLGFVGDEDMNYQELYSAQTLLNNLNIENEIFSYEDGHKWPSEIQIDRGLAWLELQAYKRNLKPVHIDIVKSMYNKTYALADSLELDQPYNAMLEYERLERNYKAYFDVDSIRRKIITLRLSDSYLKEVSERRRIEVNEYELFERFSAKFNEESILGKSEDNFLWWKRNLKALDEEEELNRSCLTKKMIKRLRNKLMTLAIETSNSFVRTKEFTQATYCDKLLTLMYPDQPYWFFKLAKSYARQNQLSLTLLHLKNALKLGFNNKSAIYNAHEFEKFKTKKKFQKFLELINN